MTDQHNTEKFAIPLSFEQMKEFIVDPSKRLTIDYKNSQLRDKALLVYCTNINLQNITFDFTGCEKEEIFSLIDSYITHKSIIKIEMLIQCVVKLMMFARGTPILPEFQIAVDFANQVLPDADLRAYCDDETRRDNLTRLMLVLDSIPLYLLTTNTAFEEAFGKPTEVFQVIDDINFTGYTFVNLFEHPVFLLQYYTSAFASGGRYFKQQFEETLYKGKSLYYYFVNNETNFLLPLLDAILSGTITPEFLEGMREALLQAQGQESK